MDRKFIIILGTTDDKTMMERLRYAELLLKNKKGFTVIFSGTNREAHWMKNHSSLPGIIENKSITTYDNLINSKRIMCNAEKVWIVTDRTHYIRTRYLASRIIRDIPFEILSKRMPISYHLKQLWYEVTRFIHNVLH